MLSVENHDESTFEFLLSRERPRLVCLCAWFSGSLQAAEDLAQETLTAAWKNRLHLYALDRLKPWTTAIARNICLNWSRQRNREQAHQAADLDAPVDWLEEIPSVDNLPEQALARQELARQLGQAVSGLPAQTASMLVDFYIREIPQAEIAAKLGVNPGTVAVRLQRAKLALRKQLRPHLVGEAIGGSARQGAPDWEQTNIWCPMCGQSRLLGLYQREKGAGRFAMRCPACNPHPDRVMAGLDLSIPRHARLLAGTKTFKPAYNRLKIFVADFFHQALSSKPPGCPACGGAVVIRVDHGKTLHKPPFITSQLLAVCSRCGWASNTNLTGLVMALPQVQQFWRENPRIHTLPPEEIETQGTRAFVTRLKSIHGAAELAVISRRDTLQAVSVHTNTGP